MKKIFIIIATFAIALSGNAFALNFYANNDQNDHGHDHSGEEPIELKYSKIVDGYEVYLAIQPLEAGSNSHFHLQLTELGTYKPINTAKVTMKIGDTVITGATAGAGADGKVKDYSYHFGMKAGAKGNYKMSATAEIDGKVIVFDLGEITSYGCVSEAKQEENPEEIKLSKSWMWSHDFAVEIVKKSPFKEVIRTRGEILPATNSKSVIVAPTAGIVNFSENMIAGKKVGPDQAIGFINSRGLEENIETRLNILKAEYENMKSNYDRNVILFKDLIVSEQTLKNSYNGYIVAKENYESLSKIYDKRGVKIIAHSSAIITEIMVSENQFVQAGDIIATAEFNKENMLKADVSKYDYSLIGRIFDANFIPEYSSKTYNVKKLGGMRLISSVATRENSAYIPVFFSLPNNPNIVPFSYAEVFLIVGSIGDVISVPKEAIAENEGLNWVYIQTGGESFEKVDVKLGGGDGDRRIVLSGLEEGDVVVTVGSAKVRQSETSGAEIPHGHAH